MANLFIRTYTFIDGTTAYGSQVETEIGTNLSTVLNNLNAGTTQWGIVSISNATSVPLIADCAGGTQDIADFKNNNVTKFKILSTGEIVIVASGLGIVLTTPDGTKTYRLFVDNNGVFNTIEVS